MRIVTLVEDNPKRNDLGYEHGVSFYIETSNHFVLFDVGQSDLFLQNAIKLGIDLSLVDTVIISHGHYDHGGGLSFFLSYNKKAKIYIQSTAFENFYSKRDSGELTYIGLDKNLDLSRFIVLTGDHIIDDELTLINQIDGKTYFPLSNQTLFKKANQAFQQDDFIHEQNLLIHDNKKVILLAGCAHKGILNIINQVETVWMNQSIQAVIGGFHLASRFPEYAETKETILALGNQLLSKPINHYYTGHCTGITAYNDLKRVLKERLSEFYPGLTITI